MLVEYVRALFLVFFLLILVRILLSWVPTAPVSGWARSIYDFFHQTTDWYLNLFRRIIPPIGMFDISPIAAIIVLFIVQSVVLSILGSV